MGKRAPEDNTSFSGRWFTCASASLGVSTALTAGERAMGHGHPNWPWVKQPAGLFLMDTVLSSQSQASLWGGLCHAKSMRDAGLLGLSRV